MAGMAAQGMAFEVFVAKAIQKLYQDVRGRSSIAKELRAACQSVLSTSLCATPAQEKANAQAEHAHYKICIPFIGNFLSNLSIACDSQAIWSADAITTAKEQQPITAPLTPSLAEKTIEPLKIACEMDQEPLHEICLGVVHKLV
jgi:hypothetical protein